MSNIVLVWPYHDAASLPIREQAWKIYGRYCTLTGCLGSGNRSGTILKVVHLLQEMEMLVDDELVDAIGLSNFNEQEVQTILDCCSEHKPACNQVSDGALLCEMRQ